MEEAKYVMFDRRSITSATAELMERRADDARRVPPSQCTVSIGGRLLEDESTVLLLQEFFRECDSYFPQGSLALVVHGKNSRPAMSLASLLQHVAINSFREIGLYDRDAPILGTDLGPLAQVLGRQQKLEEFFCFAYNRSELDPAPLLDVLSRLPNMKKIVLVEFYWKELSTIIAPLENNTHLIDLILAGCRGLEYNLMDKKKDIEALHALVRSKNFTLQNLDFGRAMALKLRIDAECIQKLDEIEFYLKLNKYFDRELLLGRRHPEENATQRDWVNVIVGAKDDVSVVFYYLSHKPSLLLMTTMQSPLCNTQSPHQGCYQANKRAKLA
jgi:hypothetical protein